MRKQVMTNNDTEQVSLEEIMKQHWFDYIDANHKVRGYNSDRLRHADEEAITALTLWHKQQAYKEMLEIIDKPVEIIITNADIDGGEEVAVMYDVFREKLRAAIKVKYGGTK